MPLPLPGVASHWTAQIGALALAEMTCFITIYDPANVTSVPYNSATDTDGFTGPTVIAAGIPARVAFVRYARPVNGIVDWSVNRTARIQIPLAAVTVPITKGFVIRVTAIGTSDDPVLLQIGFTVETAANGSLAAVRTINCMTSISVAPAVGP
jgi:hypothetical protein